MKKLMILENNKSVALYSNMLKIRLVEEEIALRYGEQEMRCPCLLYTSDAADE